MATSYHAWVRRLNFRFAETKHYIDLALSAPREEDELLFNRHRVAAIDHARALWSIALFMTEADRAEYLERMK